MLLWSSSAHGDIVISLHESCFAEAEVLRLKDVATVKSSEPGRLGALVQRLLELDVADFPTSLKNTTIDREEIRLRVRLGVVTNETLSIVGPKRVSVTRNRTRIGDEEILKKVTAALAAKWDAEPSAIKTRLLRPLSDDALDGVLPNELDVVVPERALPGSLHAKLLIRIDGSLNRTLDLHLDAQLMAETVAVATGLKRGHLLTDDDLIVRWQPVRKPGNALSRDEIVGQSLRLSVKAGQIIESRMLTSATINTIRQAQVIKSRDVVRLVARKQNLSVTVNNAEALQAGAVGDRIRVRNPSSQRIVVARIVSSTEVEMEL